MLVQDVAQVKPGTMPGQIDRYNALVREQRMPCKSLAVLQADADQTFESCRLDFD